MTLDELERAIQAAIPLGFLGWSRRDSRHLALELSRRLGGRALPTHPARDDERRLRDARIRDQHRNHHLTVSSLAIRHGLSTRQVRRILWRRKSHLFPADPG